MRRQVIRALPYQHILYSFHIVECALMHPIVNCYTF